MKTILETKELCKYYQSHENVVKAVDHIDLQIQQGEFVTIIGKSGSGKSTSGKIQPDTRSLFLLHEIVITAVKTLEYLIPFPFRNADAHQLRTPLGALRACFSLYTEVQEQKENSSFFTKSLLPR